jgi:dihydropteroate synthase
MGVVNVTPDSFSDGGRFFDHAAALNHARALIAAGADILDIGGESTRPGAEPATELEELRRAIPLIEALRAESAIPISIDTVKPSVARAAVDVGAGLWNDVTALSHTSESLDVAAELGCEVALMHMRGEPRTMQDDPRYEDVVGEVLDFLLARADAAVAAGVPRERILIDPGIGFGKTPGHNLILLAQMNRFVATGYRVLLGVSRKRFIRAVDNTAVEASDRLGGSLAAMLTGVENGCALVRVHDVRETVQALKVRAAIIAARCEG